MDLHVGVWSLIVDLFNFSLDIDYEFETCGVSNSKFVNDFFFHVKFCEEVLRSVYAERSQLFFTVVFLGNICWMWDNRRLYMIILKLIMFSIICESLIAIYLMVLEIIEFI